MHLSLSPTLGTAAGSASSLPGLLALINGAGSSSAHDYTRATSSPWASDDLSTNNNDHSSPTPEPTIDASLGAVFDGVANVVQANVGTVTFVASLVKSASSTVGIILETGSGTILTQYSNGDASALFGTGTTVDGVAVTTRDALHDALVGGGEHVLMVNGLSIGGADSLRIGRSFLGMIGSVRRVAVLDETSLAGDLAEARTLAAGVGGGMSDSKRTQGERITAVEVELKNLGEVLKEALHANGETAKVVQTKIEAIEDHLIERIDGLETLQRKDAAELQAIKNRGAGILIGVGLAGSAIGAALSGGLSSLAELFK